jgi:UDP-sugar pyrophosphorylase
MLRQGDEPEDDPIVGSLRALGQQHLFAKWAARGQEVEAKRKMIAQLRLLDANYPGGLAAYIQSARKLLGMAQRGENPLAGWVPSVPSDGHHLEPGTEKFAG